MVNLTLDSMHNQSLLEAWNAELAGWLVPDSAILFLYLILGVVGNSLVIYIHTWKLTSNKDDRYFIPALAMVDTASCILNVGFSVSINTLPVMYTNGIACKTMWFFCMAITLASVLMLVLIAVQRYQKICKPFGRQMTLFWKRISILLVIVLSLLVSWPCFFFYGPKEVVSSKLNIVGLRCTSVRGNRSKIEALIFKAVIFLITAASLVSLITLYTLIGKVVFQQIKFRKLRKMDGPAESGSTDTQDTSLSTGGKTSENGNSKNVQSPVNPTVTPENNTCDSGIVSSDDKPSNDIPISGLNSASSKTKVKKPENRIQGVRLSLIFMVITGVFIISYIPKVIMMVYESKKENFWTELTHAEMGGYRFLYTAFIINNMVNPFIYGFFDRRFRQEVKKIFCCNRKK